MTRPLTLWTQPCADAPALAVVLERRCGSCDGTGDGGASFQRICACDGTGWRLTESGEALAAFIRATMETGRTH